MKINSTNTYFHIKKILFLSYLIVGLHGNVLAQDAASYSSEVLVKYHRFALQLFETTPGFTPPLSSRALGYMGLCSYESVVPGLPNYQSADGILNGLGPGAITDPSSGVVYHYPTVANNSLALLVDSLFANMTTANRTALQQLRDSLNTVYQAQISASQYNNSLAWGEDVGNDVFDFSRTDGGHRGYLSNFPASYTVPTGSGLWVPTPPNFAPIPLQPYWGDNRPFIPSTNTTDVPGAPPVAYDATVGSPFYNYADHVYQTGNNLTSEQQDIARYWADGTGTVTPPGHSVSMLSKIITEHNENLAFATIAFAKLDMAMLDAFVNCWETKYQYNLLRPVTYIQQNINASWLPYIATPPFPEYTSGHSTQSGAFSSVMESLYGAQYAFTDNTHGAAFGGPRTYSSFDQAAAEAAISRLYGGIHYEFSNNLGVTIGNNIGQHINRLFATQLRTSQSNPDIALQMSISQSQAIIGNTIQLSVYVLNQGMTDLNNLQIQVQLPAGLTGVSATPENGTYNAGTGIWTIPFIDAGAAVTELQLQVQVAADGVPITTAELIAMDETDADSTPNNGVVTEDDHATVCLSVPIITCNINITLDAPAGYSSYQWYKSTDNGANFVPIATTPSITVTQPGWYTFGVEGAVLGNCGNQLCCPVMVQQYCCPVNKCMPISFVKH